MRDKLMRFVYPQTLSRWTGYATLMVVLSLPIYFLMAVAGIMVSALPCIGEGYWLSIPFVCWHLFLWLRGLQGIWLLSKVSATRGEITSAIAWLMMLVMFQLFSLGIAFSDWSLRF